MRQVQLIGIHLEATSGTPVVLLREHEAPHRVLPIFVGGPEAASIAVAASGQVADRPLTHDVMAQLVEQLHGHVDAVEVTELRDGAFHARLALSSPAGEVRVDTRPSDAIALAIRVHAPVYVSEDVLDVAGTVLAVEPGETPPADIEGEVEAFRGFLDRIEPADFGDGNGGDDADGGHGGDATSG